MIILVVTKYMNVALYVTTLIICCIALCRFTSCFILLAYLTCYVFILIRLLYIKLSNKQTINHSIIVIYSSIYYFYSSIPKFV